MKYYVAPLEGITGYIFRNAYNSVFKDSADAFYAPFIMPHKKRALSSKELNDICHDNNNSIKLIPQILTKDAEDFTRLASYMNQELGYSEINLNLGCPSKTVTSKGRGAAFLQDIPALDDFLYNVYDAACGKYDISIKTRIGVNSPNEFDEILNIYNKYPVKELIIHPRVMIEMYQGMPHTDVFINALNKTNVPLCYNGNIFSKEDYNNITSGINSAVTGEKIPGKDSDRLSSVMLGRGVLRNPSLIREIKGGKSFNNDEILSFLTLLRSGYSQAFSGETPVLFKLKEIWSYLQVNYADKTNLCHKLLKSKSMSEYLIYEKQLLS